MEYIVDNTARTMEEPSVSALQRTRFRITRASAHRCTREAAQLRYKLVGYLKLRRPRRASDANMIYTCVFDAAKKVYYVGYDTGRLLQNDCPEEMVLYRKTEDIRKRFFSVRETEKCGC